MATFLSYDANVNREELLGVLKMLDPTEVFAQNFAGDTSIKSTKPEWPEVAIDSPAVNKRIQGADYSGSAATAASRTYNYTQISGKDVKISATQEAIANAADVDHLTKQKARKLRALVGDIELAIVTNTASVAGASATSGVTLGMVGFIDTNVQTGGTGGVSEANFNAVLELVWKAGGEIATVVCGSTQCTAIDGFDGNSDKFQLLDKGILNSTINIYRTRYGKAVIVPHRIMESVHPQHILFLGDASFWKVGYLRRPKWEPLAKNGPSTGEFCEAEYALICYNEKSSGQYIGS